MAANQFRLGVVLQQRNVMNPTGPVSHELLQVPQPADLIHLMDGVISSTKRAWTVWNMAGVVSNPMDYRDHRRVRGDGPLGPAIRRAQRTNGQTTRRGVRDAGAVATTCRKTKIKPGRVCPKHWYRQNPVFFTVYHHICDKS